MLWQALLAATNLGLVRMFDGNTEPLPEKFGLGRLYPCCRTQSTYLVIVVCEIRPAKLPRRKPKFAPQALNAACSFGLFAKRPLPPPDRHRRTRRPEARRCRGYAWSRFRCHRPEGPRPDDSAG